MKKQRKRNIILIIVLSIVRVVGDIIFLKYLKHFLDLLISICSCAMLFLIFISFILINIGEYLFSPIAQYGEFPFEIVYSVDGEIFKNEGVIACEYYFCAGDLVHESGMTTSMSYKNSSDGNLLCKKDYEIYLDDGSAKYYLWNQKPFDDYLPGKYIYYTDNLWHQHELTLDAAKEQFGIEIISTSFSLPATRILYKPESVAVKLCMITVSFFTLILLVRLCRRTKYGLYTDSKRRIRT